VTIKMILADLDGTLLNQEGRLSPQTRQALEHAAQRGILVVPATGRPYETLPPDVRELPFLRYAVLLNGAQVFDCVHRQAICRQELSQEDAQTILRRLEDFPALVECFAADGGVYMEQRFYDKLDQWVVIPTIRAIMKKSRTAVPSLSGKIAQMGGPVEKIHVYTAVDYRDTLLDILVPEFSFASVSCSVPGNIEITNLHATKAQAMKQLCNHLHIPLEQVVAFGDERNDRDMILEAGLGVAMGNALPEIKDVANRIAPPNTQDGVAAVIRDLLGLTGE
jgi:Cof subfamily protein (haloacid dehalogenase superfamily)